tara:strand:+ start:436 stop:840 length:405 start_codon:yes stop_codon:yes gene_type:complete
MVKVPWRYIVKAIIVKGNPKFIRSSLAKDYYSQIETFLLDNGVKEVSFDPGEDFTCPDRSADFYIGHSRGAGRIRCMKTGEEWRFLQFGDPDDIMHPKDREWHGQQGSSKPTSPPKEHFLFIDEQKRGDTQNRC